VEREREEVVEERESEKHTHHLFASSLSLVDTSICAPQQQIVEKRKERHQTKPNHSVTGGDRETPSKNE